MVKRINLTVNDEVYNLLEVYRIENNFSDNQDAIRNIIENELVKKEKSFFQNLFSFK